MDLIWGDPGQAPRGVHRPDDMSGVGVERYSAVIRHGAALATVSS